MKTKPIPPTEGYPSRDSAIVAICRVSERVGTAARQKCHPELNSRCSAQGPPSRGAHRGRYDADAAPYGHVQGHDGPHVRRGRLGELRRVDGGQEGAEHREGHHDEAEVRRGGGEHEAEEGGGEARDADRDDPAVVVAGGGPLHDHRLGEHAEEAAVGHDVAAALGVEAEAGGDDEGEGAVEDGEGHAGEELHGEERRHRRERGDAPDLAEGHLEGLNR